MPGKMWLHAFGLHLGELQWFAHPNSVAAALGMPPAHPKVSAEALSLLGRYAEDCFGERGKCAHPRCSNIDLPSLPPLLPRRVIDIGDINADCSPSLRLHESVQDERGHYTTLSHRWGNEIIYRTTIENIKTRRNGIDFDELPMSFKDAISVTRALGVRYLWIDAICIVQNDHSDWMNQAPLMGKIYKHSYCTIAAHSAQNSADGFLKSQSSLSPVKVATCLSLKAGPGRICIGIPRSFKETIDCSYINQRGWVLQELTLSQRTAHFSNGYIYWECPHTTTPRSVGYTAEPSIKTSLALKSQGTGEDFVESWMDLVTEYSKCQLTYGTDKLVAISGIAAEWQSHLGEGGGRRYHSGLFECTLPRSLLWFSGGGSLKRVEKRAPSWSWASVDGQIQFMKTQKTTVVATLKAVDNDGGDVVTPDSHQCRLTIHTSVRSVFITKRSADFGTESCTAQSFLRPRGIMVTGYHLEILGILGGGQASIDDGSKNPGSVHCARVCTMEVKQQKSMLQLDFVLLLELVNSRLAHYKRIGVGIIVSEGFFDISSPQDIVII
ncbi:heterokaryon incompatibility protein-domain-containing protein [Rhexocercosporidium sp. MPI-PUGE-AT-0058]|nr:heterokaryon incompatibility protein-domain-containing protein [Rhexocercosporidium sp. MPI-PUGE-AT-0058]